MKILVSYRAAPNIHGWETGAMIASAFRSLGHEVYEYARIYQTDQWVMPNPQSCFQDYYDLVLIMECNDPESQYYHLLNVRAAHRVGWFFDVSYYTPQSMNIIHQYELDCLFLANPYLVLPFQQFLKIPVFFLPYACSKELHFRPVFRNLKHFDVLMIGSLRDERKRIADYISDSGLNVKVIEGVFKEDYIDRLNEAWITINENPHGGMGLLNMRTFEAPAAGSFLFHQAGDGLINIFKHGSFAYYHKDRLAELVYNIKNMLSEKDYLLYCTELNQRYILQYHTYRLRAKKILETIE